MMNGDKWLDEDGGAINAHGGGMLLHDGVYYWYGEHRSHGATGRRAEVGVRVYSSRDLLKWRNEGVALAVSDDPESEIARGCALERPKVLFCAATGKFVLWFHLERPGLGYSYARSGVAVADAPSGPFTFLRSVRPNAGFWPLNAPLDTRRPLAKDESEFLARLELRGGSVPYYPKHLIFRRDFAGGQMARDMTLFVDDDGIAVHVYASEENGVLHVAELAPDFLSHTGRWIRVAPGRFNEAPALMKHDGRYFIFASGCTGWRPNESRLLASDSLFGEWEELGNPCFGTAEQVVNSFESQPAYVFDAGDGRHVLMADRWRPDDLGDSRYVWLAIRMKHGVPVVEWEERWGSLGS